MTYGPTVSIGIPTYNRAGRLPKAISSALAQDYPNLEVVVCDNGSTDDTEAICREIVAGDARVRYVRQRQNIGAAGNFRTAFERTRGELFGWLSDDDWMEPSHVRHCVDALLARPDHAVVGGQVRHHTGDESIVEPVVDLSQATPAERVRHYFQTVNLNGVFYGVVRRDCLRQARIERTLGFDWMVAAALLATGKAATLDHVTLHRSTGGASKDHISTAESLNVSPLFARDQITNYSTIAAHAFKQIAWTCPAFAGLGAIRRHRLAFQSADTIFRRFALDAVKARLRAGAA